MSSHSLHVHMYVYRHCCIRLTGYDCGIPGNGNASVIQFPLIFEVVKLRKSQCATSVRPLHMPNIYSLHGFPPGKAGMYCRMIPLIQFCFKDKILAQL